MTVQVRLKRGESRIRRHRQGRAEHPSLRTTPVASADTGRPDSHHPRRDRQPGPPQDHAIYNCHCGFVFQAAVSTSVGCPHCGGTQAW
jgi:hypothetical protein